MKLFLKKTLCIVLMNCLFINIASARILENRDIKYIIGGVLGVTALIGGSFALGRITKPQKSTNLQLSEDYTKSHNEIKRLTTENENKDLQIKYFTEQNKGLHGLLQQFLGNYDLKNIEIEQKTSEDSDQNNHVNTNHIIVSIAGKYNPIYSIKVYSETGLKELLNNPKKLSRSINDLIFFNSSLPKINAKTMKNIAKIEQ